jgi:hypothetical protein
MIRTIFVLKIYKMKKLRTIVSILFLSMILLGMTSCEVGLRIDNGRHRGWFHKNENNHHRRGTVLIINQDHQNYQEHR